MMTNDIKGDAEFGLILTDAPEAAARAVIEDGLSQYNVEQAGYRDWRPLAVLVKDPATGATLGGLVGRTSLGLFFVERFYLPSALRRRDLGSRVLRHAEEEAKRRGCRNVALITMTIQAPGFYARQGYRELGRIPCDPPGHARVFMTKALTASASTP
jgi:GNAT superfamily N-acetyltransferase